jgi:hypothetical protein
MTPRPDETAAATSATHTIAATAPRRRRDDAPYARRHADFSTGAVIVLASGLPLEDRMQ